VRAFMPREFGGGHKVGDDVGIAVGRHQLFPAGGGTGRGQLEAADLAEAVKKGSQRP